MNIIEKTYFDTSLCQPMFFVKFTEEADIERDQSEDGLLNAHHTIFFKSKTTLV